jgi:antitoxin component YwqK of YwqJK toxin-antitoxin module
MRLLLGFTLFLFSSISFAQDTARVKISYGDLRYMQPVFKTKNGFQVYDIKKCSGADCPPTGKFTMYADSLQKQRLYEGEIRNGQREGVWSYFDKKGDTVCEEEYISGRLVRYTIYNAGTEVYERIVTTPSL